MPGLLIGDVAKRVGVSSPTIRYYEELGLLTQPVRSSSGYRRYSDSTLTELRFIQKAKRLGFSQHLAAVDERIEHSRSERTGDRNSDALCHAGAPFIHERQDLRTLHIASG